MPPPDLARDVPVRCVLEGGDCEAVLGLRMEPDAPRAERLEGRLLELRHRAPPLERDSRLDAVLAAVAHADGVPVGLALLELSALAQPRDDALARLLLRQARQLAGRLVHAPVGADHGELRQAVVLPDLVVLRVVPRRDLERPGGEVPLDTLVGDHRYAPLDPRHDHLSADEVPVAVVVGMNRDGDVGEDGRRPHGRDGDVTVTVREGVPDVRQRVVDIDVGDLEIGERREVERAPVDDPVGSVDPSLAIQVHEEPHHRADVGLIHREPLAPIVERGADAPELEHDLAAVFAEPFPHALLERLTAEVLTRLPLGGEVLLDGVLRRDTCVVVPRLEEDVVALHPPRPHDRVGE